MPELEHVPISELGYNRLNQSVRNWIEQDLKWKCEDIFSVHIKYETIETNAGGEGWKKWGHGKNIDVTLTSMSQEKKHQRFVRLNNGDWEKGAN